MWTVLEISFREGAAAVEHARTFLQRSESCLVKITLLWDNPTWIVPVCWDDIDNGRGGLPPPSREEIMAGAHLGLVIQELYAHIHRWRQFTLRTTSITHTYQALALMSRPSSQPAHELKKLHLQFVHNPRHASHHISEPSLFPGSAPPIRDLLLFGISWAWPSPSALSSNLVNLRIHYDAWTNDDGGNARTGREAKMLWQYTQVPTVKTLTLGPRANTNNLALAMRLLPTPNGPPGLPLPGLRTLAMFDVPKQIILERHSLTAPLEELCCRYCAGDENKGVPDDWQHQVEKYYCIGGFKSVRYTDVVGRQWSYLV